MHLSLLKSSLHWSLSFFDTTPIGRILNRFSNDIYVLDLTLPQLLQAGVQMFFSVIRKKPFENCHVGSGTLESFICLYFPLVFVFLFCLSIVCFCMVANVCNSFYILWCWYNLITLSGIHSKAHNSFVLLYIEF